MYVTQICILAQPKCIRVTRVPTLSVFFSAALSHSIRTMLRTFLGMNKWSKSASCLYMYLPNMHPRKWTEGCEEALRVQGLLGFISHDSNCNVYFSDCVHVTIKQICVKSRAVKENFVLTAPSCGLSPECPSDHHQTDCGHHSFPCLSVTVKILSMSSAPGHCMQMSCKEAYTFCQRAPVPVSGSAALQAAQQPAILLLLFLILK